MDCILGIFDALVSFARPATRAELEIESGLDKRGVENGLAGLMRRQLIHIDGGPRILTTYRLVTAAERPETLRGRYPRHQTPAVRAVGGHYSAALPPSHDASPSAVRIVARGMLETHGRGIPETFSSCLLADLWRKR